MRAADTNILVRVVTRDLPDRLPKIEAFIERGVWVSHLVLAEMAWVLRTVYNRSHADVAAAIEMLLKHDKFVLHEADVVAAALAHYRRAPKLGFSDYFILEIARKAGHLPLGTFDRNLGKLEGAESL
jgi:predicted nucleic-acid-binding protein